MKKLITLILGMFTIITSHAQSSIEEGWKYWEQAEFEKAENIAQAYINTDEGKHLQGNIFQVRGKYQEAIDVYEKVSQKYKEYEKVQISKHNIYIFHLKQLDKAKGLINSINKKEATIYAASIDKPMTVECSGTFTVPMQVNEPLNPYIPIVSASINGTKEKIAFDTGGNYLILSKKAATRLNITYDSTLFFIGSQGFSKSKMWVGLIDELILGSEVKLNNVPVTILEEMNTEIIIFGTNIIKEFYTTVDYPNNQFVFTTKDKPELIEKHKEQYKGNSMDFVMWGDHYMMGKGTYNGKKINMFFDSGLVVVGQVDGAITQSWLCLSKKNMKNLGIEEVDKTSLRGITPTDDVLGFAGLNHENIVLSQSGTKEFSFGEVKCDLLVSHGIIKNYAWTIDFNQMVYMFK